MSTTHYLPANHNTEIPSAAIWLDTESHQSETTPGTLTHTLWFGWMAYSRRLKGDRWSDPEWVRFDTITDAWAAVDQRVRQSSKTYLFVHNASFDLPILDCFGELPRRGWTLKAAVIQCPPTILTFRHGSRTLTVLDTLNFWRMPLSKLGEMVGAPKLPMPSEGASADEWDTYCKNDVAVLRTACVTWWHWIREQDLGGFASTLAGQAMRAYRHRFMEHPILIDGDGPSVTLARKSYIGGRCECRHIGEIPGPIHVFDVNSLYPSVMADGAFPTRRIGYVTNIRPESVTRWLKHDAIIARVSLKTPEAWYPVIHKGFSMYPVGEFEAILCTPELRRAYQAGHITHWHEAAVYETAPIFQTYVNYMYDARLRADASGDHTRAGLFKLLLNSLYGKFGQTGHETLTKEWIDDLSASSENGWDVERQCRVSIMQLAGLRMVTREHGEGRDAMVAIAAHVTSSARMKLLSLIEKAGTHHVYYYDTDSLFVDAEGAARLAMDVDPTRIGALKREGVFPSLTLYGPKDYILGPKRKTKGVRANAVWTGPNTLEQDKWTSLRGMLRAGDCTQPTTVRTRKVLVRVYQKGVVTRDGDVTPFVFTHPAAPTIE